MPFGAVLKIAGILGLSLAQVAPAWAQWTKPQPDPLECQAQVALRTHFETIQKSQLPLEQAEPKIAGPVGDKALEYWKAGKEDAASSASKHGAPLTLVGVMTWASKRALNACWEAKSRVIEEKEKKEAEKKKKSK